LKSLIFQNIISFKILWKSKRGNEETKTFWKLTFLKQQQKKFFERCLVTIFLVAIYQWQISLWRDWLSLKCRKLKTSKDLNVAFVNSFNVESFKRQRINILNVEFINSFKCRKLHSKGLKYLMLQLLIVLMSKDEKVKWCEGSFCWTSSFIDRLFFNFVFQANCYKRWFHFLFILTTQYPLEFRQFSMLLFFVVKV